MRAFVGLLLFLVFASAAVVVFEDQMEAATAWVVGKVR